jgi:hypothetical protein
MYLFSSIACTQVVKDRRHHYHFEERRWNMLHTREERPFGTEGRVRRDARHVFFVPSLELVLVHPTTSSFDDHNLATLP